MDEHLASCSECHEVFAETLRFALDEEAAGVVPPVEPGKARWFQSAALRPQREGEPTRALQQALPLHPVRRIIGSAASY